MLRLALIQPPADLGAPHDRLTWLTARLEGIAERADLVLLPELFATGYNIGANVAARAEARDGAIFAGMAELAARHDVALLYGYPERDGDALFNAALCVGPTGDVLGHHRKLSVPPGFEGDYFTPGTGCSVFSYCGVRIAILICFDAEFPETVRHVAAAGAELVLVPTALGADWGWVSQTMIPTRAYENGVYLAYANSSGSENGMAFLGASVIAAPDGKEAARADAAPGVLFADIDPARVASARCTLPYLQDRLALKL